MSRHASNLKGAILRRIPLRSVTAIWRHPYPALMSLAVATVFGERLLVHEMVYRDVPLRAALSQASVWFTTLALWLIVLVAFAVDKRKVKATLRSIRHLAVELFRHVFSKVSLLLVVMAVLAVTFGSAVHGVSILETIHDWSEPLGGPLHEAKRPEFVMLACSIGIALAIAYVLERYLGRANETVESATYETSVAAGIAIVGGAAYVWLNTAFLWPAIAAGFRSDAFGGLIKDTSFYVLVTVVVVGMSKIADSLKTVRSGQIRTLVCIATVFAMVLIITVAVAFDLIYKDAFLPSSSEYPPEKTRLIANHIMVRDFGMLVPILAVATVVMFRKAAERRARRPAKA